MPDPKQGSTVFSPSDHPALLSRQLTPDFVGKPDFGIADWGDAAEVRMRFVECLEEYADHPTSRLFGSHVGCLFGDGADTLNEAVFGIFLNNAEMSIFATASAFCEVTMRELGREAACNLASQLDPADMRLAVAGNYAAAFAAEAPQDGTQAPHLRGRLETR